MVFSDFLEKQFQMELFFPSAFKWSLFVLAVHYIILIMS